MSLSKQYRHVKSMLAGQTLTLPVWDLLVIMDMAERGPMLDAEERYVESMNNMIGARVTAILTNQLSALAEEQAKTAEAEKQEEMPKKQESQSETIDLPAKVSKELIGANGKTKT